MIRTPLFEEIERTASMTKTEISQEKMPVDSFSDIDVTASLS